jgi:transposase
MESPADPGRFKLQRLLPTLAPGLLALAGCAALTAAKILGETAGVDRFRSQHAYARYNGTAPLPVWSRSGPTTGNATASCRSLGG